MAQNQQQNRGNFANDAERASDASRAQGAENNPGNFANDREKASRAGEKGGR